MLERFKINFTNVKVEVSSFTWPLVVASLLIVLFVLLAMCCWKRFHPTIMKGVRYIKVMLMYNSLIRYFIQAFLRMTLISMFNLKYTFTNEDFGSTSNTIASSLMLVLLVSFMIFSFFFMRKNRNKLEEPTFIQRFGSLYEPILTGNEPALLVPFIFCLRRLLIALIIVYITINAYLQIVLL